MSSSTSRHGHSSHDTIADVGVVVPVVVAVVVPHAVQAAGQISATRVPKKVCAQISRVRLDDENPRDLHMSGSVVPLHAVIVVADVVVVVTVVVVETVVVEAVVVVTVAVVEGSVSVVEVAVVVVRVAEVVLTVVVLTVVVLTVVVLTVSVEVVVDGMHTSHDAGHKRAVVRNMLGSALEYSSVHINLRFAHFAGSSLPLHTRVVVEVMVEVVAVVVVAVEVVAVVVVAVSVVVVVDGMHMSHDAGHN